MKKVMVEMWFLDDFVPPYYCEEPCAENNWMSECKRCPLFSWSDDYGVADCHYGGQWEEEDGKLLCPIRKFFIEED